MKRTRTGSCIVFAALLVAAFTPQTSRGAPVAGARNRAAYRPGWSALSGRGGWVGALRGNRNYGATLSGTPIVIPSDSIYALDYSGAWHDIDFGTYTFTKTSTDTIPSKQQCTTTTDCTGTIGPCPPSTVTITATAGANGTITPSGSVVVVYGADQTFVITPNAGFHISDVVVDGVSQRAVSPFTFSTVYSSHIISATFAMNALAPSLGSGRSGGVSIESSNSTCYFLKDAPSTPNGDACSPDRSASGDSIWTIGTIPVGNAVAVIEEPAFPIPPNTGTMTVEWDHYLDIPYGDGYVQTTEYRFFRGGAWSSWRNTNPSGRSRSGSDRAWVTEAEEIPEAAQADSIQVRHWLRCLPSQAPDQANCPQVSPGILYDNFGIFAFTGFTPTPVFGLAPALAPQTTFVDGTMTGVNCAAPPCWPGVRGTGLGAGIGINDNVNSATGDSIVVRIHSARRTNGMGVNWHVGFDKSVSGGLTIARTNASYNPAWGAPRLIYRLFDPATRTWTPYDSTELDADDVHVGATDTTVTESSFRFDWPPRDKAGLSLPGGATINGVSAYNSLAFLPHGTRLQYYLKAVDAAGVVAYQFQGDDAPREVADLPTLPGGAVVAPDVMEFDVLPRVYPPGGVGTLLAGRTNTPILNLDGAYTAWSFAQDPVTQALRGLGVRADRYRLQQEPGRGNGIGGHELTGPPDNQHPDYPTSHFPNMTEYAIRESLSVWYRILIVSTHLRNATLLDEPDARLIEEWWNSSTAGSSGGDRCLFVSGDDAANMLLNNFSEPATRRTSLAQNVLGVASAVNAWNGTASVLYPTIDDRFANPASGPALVAGYTYPVDCGCPGPNRFDALTKAGPASSQNAVFYPTVSGITQVAGVATMVEKDAVTDKDRNKALTYAFSIQFARKAGIPTNASDYPHSGVQERMQVLYKFLASCRGARTGAIADSGKCWPCPTDANLMGNWAVLTGFQTGVYGPLYPIQDNTTVTSVDPGGGDVPAARNSLRQNRPNPFNPSTTIPFTTAVAGRTLIRVYDVAGRLIRTIDTGLAASGEHLARWDGRDQNGGSVGTGVYFYQIEFPGGGTSSRKMILLR